MRHHHADKARMAVVALQPLAVGAHRVLYVLRTRGHITPLARAGRLRLYDREAVALIRHELNAIDARRDASKGDGDG